MSDGFEIDMLSLGDADCIIVTCWTAHLGPQRILIDGGNRSDFDVVRDFLADRGMTNFWAVVCTHLHGDHAGGLVKLVRDRSFTFQTAWMHDIRKHLTPDALRRASAGPSQQARDVKEIWETTRELDSAFAGRGLMTREPFGGAKIADYPLMTVLGPSLPFYRRAIREWAGIEVPPPVTPSFLEVLSGIGPDPSAPLSRLFFAPPPSPGRPLSPTRPLTEAPLSSLLASTLKNSSLKENPSTQPFNNTSAILGVLFGEKRFMLTSDAGSSALDLVPSDWKDLWWMQVPHHGSDGNLSKSNIERFRPRFACISARGDTDHPSRAIVNALIKCGAMVCSTHRANPGHLWHQTGSVRPRVGYGPAIQLKGTSNRPRLTFGCLPSLAAEG